MIVSTAVNLATGFIVLQHDLYQQSVDMAVGYILPDALSHNPAFSVRLLLFFFLFAPAHNRVSVPQLKSVIECQHQPPSNSYAELFVNSTTGAVGTPTGGGSGSGGSGGKSGAMSTISKMDNGVFIALTGVAMGMVLLGGAW